MASRSRRSMGFVRKFGSREGGTADFAIPIYIENPAPAAAVRNWFDMTAREIAVSTARRTRMPGFSSIVRGLRGQRNRTEQSRSILFGPRSVVLTERSHPLRANAVRGRVLEKPYL
jgi:hypothetical protein